MFRSPSPGARQACAWVVVIGAFISAVLIPSKPIEHLWATVSPRAATSGDDAFVLRRSYPTGRMPRPDALAKAYRATRPLPVIRPALVLPGQQWVAIGPRPIFVPGQLNWSGRVTVIAPHPTNANALYIGTDGAGIWRTTDGGTNWTSLTDTLPVPAISSLAIDPVNPQLLYAATIDRTYPNRWLRSIDGGATWDVSTITADGGVMLSSTLCSVNVLKACIPPSSGRIFIDRAHAGSSIASTIYYTGASHVLRSDDSGRTFHAVLSLPIDLDFAGANAAARNPEALVVRDAVIDPTRSDHLVVVVAKPRCVVSSCLSMTSTIALYQSADAGAHWSQQDIASLAYSVAYTRYADPGAAYVPRARVAIAASNPNVIAVAFRDEAAARARLLRSADGGATWAEVSPPATSNFAAWPISLTINPGNADIMFLGNGIIQGTGDGGKSWITLAYTHGDNTELTFNSQGSLLAGNDGGIYRFTSNTSAVSLNAALPIAESYSIAVHPGNALLMAAGMQDSGVIVFQGSLGWSFLINGDGGDVVFDPNPQSVVLYTENEWATLGGTMLYDFYRCQPAGGCAAKSAGIDKSVDAQMLPRIAMDPSNPSTLWLTTEFMYRTDNRADAWAAASPSVKNAQRCWQDPVSGPTCAKAAYFTAAAVAPTASQTVYAGTLNGDVWMTVNRGATWASIAGLTAGPLPVRNVNDIVVDPLDSRIAYVAYSGFNSGGSGTGHIFRTTNSGQTWEDLSDNLPDMPVNSILIDPDSATNSSSTRVIYIGTDIGVFQASMDGSRNWQTFGTGLPPVVVNRLTYSPTTHQLLAATYGRGIWAISSRFR